MEPFMVTLKSRPLRGEDNHRVFSIRVPNEMHEKLELLAESSNLSRNALINAMVAHCLRHGLFQSGDKQLNIVDL
ncbi:MAG: ribbon-helix-helix domain-containing protein [Coriobacteriia bacterium]|nr:ribbon-helix-helix domain-containing protein [Coriobacteriia bacterium]